MPRSGAEDVRDGRDGGHRGPEYGRTAGRSHSRGAERPPPDRLIDTGRTQRIRGSSDGPRTFELKGREER
jgi:hypothetical protein